MDGTEDNFVLLISPHIFIVVVATSYVASKQLVFVSLHHNLFSRCVSISRFVLSLFFAKTASSKHNFFAVSISLFLYDAGN